MRHFTAFREMLLGILQRWAPEFILLFYLAGLTGYLSPKFGDSN